MPIRFISTKYMKIKGSLNVIPISRHIDSVPSFRECGLHT